MNKTTISLNLALQEHILEGHSITVLEAASLFGVPSLHPILTRLGRQGYRITREKVPLLQVIRRINSVAIFEPPKNLPINEIMVTQYTWSGR